MSYIWADFSKTISTISLRNVFEGIHIADAGVISAEMHFPLKSLMKHLHNTTIIGQRLWRH